MLMETSSCGPSVHQALQHAYPYILRGKALDAQDSVPPALQAELSTRMSTVFNSKLLDAIMQQSSNIHPVDGIIYGFINIGLLDMFARTV
jgi:hypothetical protein